MIPDNLAAFRASLDRLLSAKVMRLDDETLQALRPYASLYSSYDILNAGRPLILPAGWFRRTFWAITPIAHGSAPWTVVVCRSVYGGFQHSRVFLSNEDTQRALHYARAHWWEHLAPLPERGVTMRLSLYDIETQTVRTTAYALFAVKDISEGPGLSLVLPEPLTVGLSRGHISEATDNHRTIDHPLATIDYCAACGRPLELAYCAHDIRFHPTLARRPMPAVVIEQLTRAGYRFLHDPHQWLPR